MDNLLSIKMEPIPELNDTNIKQMCRTCLNVKSEEMISIFDEIEQMENDEIVKTNICDMLLEVDLIEVDRKEYLPTMICINCLRSAQKLFNFRKQCNTSQSTVLGYLTEKEDKVIGTLSARKNLNQDNNGLNKNFTIRESIYTEKSLNLNKNESVIIKNEVHELPDPTGSDDLLNTTVKLEVDDEIIKSDVENETGKEDKIIGTEKRPTQNNNVLNKKSAIKESIDIGKSLNENIPESIFIKNEVHELSNSSNSDDLLNPIIKLEVDETFKSDTESEDFAHTKQNPEDENVCNICNKRFKYHKYLTNHMKQHTEDKCVCKICSKRFKRPWDLTVHLRTHKDEKHYSCKICGKQYKQSGSVAIHMRMHTGQTPFLCSVCGKGFRDSTSLKVHIRTHTKERPYMCNICGKTMSVHSRFANHMRAHSGEKPYKCKECSKAFHSSVLLKAHSIVHTELKPYSCDVCKKSFNRKSTLTLHEKIHSNERPHTCPLCGKSFIQAYRLRAHLQNHK